MSQQYCKERIYTLHTGVFQIYSSVGTKWEFDNVSEIENTQKSCVGKRGTTYQKRFYAINSFVTPGICPSQTAFAKLNEESVVKKGYLIANQ